MINDANQNERNWQAHGLECYALRHPELQHWCGYVALPEGHRFHGKDYDNIKAEVHGGLTYAGDHAPRQQKDGRWWVGFDCAHAGDWVPTMKAHDGDTYKDIDFVVHECEAFASQMAEH